MDIDSLRTRALTGGCRRYQRRGFDCDGAMREEWPDYCEKDSARPGKQAFDFTNKLLSDISR